MNARLLAVAAAVLAALLSGCDKGIAPDDSRAAEVDQQVREKWGKPLAELDEVTLVVISPHNTDIEWEFSQAFSLHHALKHGQRVHIEYRDVGGGGSAILRYLQNVYAASGTAGIDIVWGGGEDSFQRLADEGLLEPLTLDDDVLENIPADFGGLAMYDPQRRWCGSAVSGFGFLYNAPLLKSLAREPPQTWEDLGGAEYFDLVGLADPMQSGSAAAAYEMIVQSAEDWPSGWAKLLGILANAKRFYEGASGAADAPVSGETAVAACIDFYGAIRVAKYPEVLVYVSPKRGTAFNADPIAILKNPPSGELARRFVDFVLSRRGQALWALPPGAEDGPVRAALGRQPIRKDVYELYAGNLSPWVVNPYETGQAMEIDRKLWRESFPVLRALVWTAAVSNREGLQAAKKKLIETDFAPSRLAEFNRLPGNVDSRDELAGVAERLGDKVQADLILTEWTTFFREKYQRVAE